MTEETKSSIPDIRWSRGSCFWSCTYKDPRFSTFRAQHSDNGILTVMVGALLVRHQRSKSYKSSQTTVRHCFVEYLKDGKVPCRMCRRNSIRGL